jgi:hypothetical protein
MTAIRTLKMQPFVIFTWVSNEVIAAHGLLDAWLKAAFADGVLAHHGSFPLLIRMDQYTPEMMAFYKIGLRSGERLFRLYGYAVPPARKGKKRMAPVTPMTIPEPPAAQPVQPAPQPPVQKPIPPTPTRKR